MQAENNQSPAPLLLPSAVLACVAVVAALLFAASFHEISEPAGPTHAGHHADPHDAAHAMHAEPQYYAGGVWSPEFGLGGLAELAASAAAPTDAVACHVLSWNAVDELLVVIDASPLTEPVDNNAEPFTIVSIDHRGGDITPGFAVMIQEHLQAIGSGNIVVWTPLPGEDTRPEDEDPYDWTFLDDGTGNIQVVDWTEVEPVPLDPNRPMSGYLNAWLIDTAPQFAEAEQALSNDLLAGLSNAASHRESAALLWQLASQSPYEVLPYLSIASVSLEYATMLMRAMRIPADELITKAAASEDPVSRSLAARAIGDLADLTSGPLGKLTPLAEDNDLRVRYEALVATRALPGRRAAGVAQLVEPYEMTDAMRLVFTDTLTSMASFGEPVQADSRALRLRRMALDVLMNEPPDALVSGILLERTDLPDDQVLPVLDQLAQAKQTEPLPTLIDLLTAMNPRTLAEREALQRTLIDWDPQALSQQRDRLSTLALGDGSTALRTTAAAALLRTESAEAVIDRTGLRPVLFEALSRINDGDIARQWGPLVVGIASGEPSSGLATRVAAFDAFQDVPDAMVRPAVGMLLETARNADEITLRFAAIRAINALPTELKPTGIDDLQLTSLTIAAVPGQMKYDLQTLTAVAGRPVEITLINPDTMEHNLVITKPGQMQAIGLQVTSMSPTEAAAIDYVPDTDAVLYATIMVPAGGSDTLRFIAPSRPGEYPYVCTFPGHYTSMFGTLEVVAP